MIDTIIQDCQCDCGRRTCAVCGKMTTLERAARAVQDTAYAYGCEVKPLLSAEIARAVLMAVLPELQRYGCDCAGSQVEDSRGEFVLYDDLAAILAEGE